MYVSELSQTFLRLEQTASRIEMTKTLAALFARATPEDIAPICYLLQGRVAPLYEPVEFGVADKFMIRAIAQAYGKSIDAVTRTFKTHGDLGAVAQALNPNKTAGKKLSVTQVFARLHGLALLAGGGSQAQKITVLAGLFSDVDAASARYIARIPLGKLRLGFSDMTILDAISWWSVGDKSKRGELERVYNIRPDIGLLAKTVKTHGIKGLARVRATVGVPILAALCQRLPTASEMIEKMGKVAVEPKYDGVRVQIHVHKDGTVRTFSRNLEDTTAMFPELSSVKKHLNAREVILDGEAIGLDPKTGKLISFQETMTRKRKHDIALAMGSVPLRFFVFDILYKDGKDLLFQPLSTRRKTLLATLKEGPILVASPQVVTGDVATLLAYHEKQRRAGLEGVVVKKWNSPYEPGRRGYNWVKFKEEEGKTGKLTDTVDGLIMGYYRGEGKRAGFGIGAFLVGVAKGDTFVTVSKIGTGVSDVLWKELHTRLNGIKASHQPKQYIDVNKMLTPDVWVTPSLVVEVAADDITRSPIHGAGVALRFPRLVGIRTDKSPKDATTVAEVRTMYAQQDGTHKTL